MKLDVCSLVFEINTYSYQQLKEKIPRSYQ